MFVDSAQASSAQNTEGGSAAAQRAMKDKEQFLALLVAQISHQDPMNPVDDKDMVSQLAQFSAIEQQIETNQNLASLKQDFATSSRLSMAGLIGKQAGAAIRGVEVPEGASPSPIAVNLSGAAQEVTVRLLDSENNLVRSVEVGAMGPGLHTIAWDGMSNSHTPLAPGRYRANIQARGANGADVPVSNQIRGTIESIDLDGRQPAVFINGARVSLNDLTEVRQ